MEDSTIIALYNARDERAIRETEVKYGDYCMSISLEILKDRMDAEECVNDTYLKAWNTIPPKKPSVLRTYLGKLVRNLSIDRLRTLHRKKRDVDLLVAAEELDRCLGTASDGTDGGLCAALDGFLAGLDATNRRLFVGRYWHSLSIKDLAGAWNLTPNAVALRLHKTRERLRTYLEKGGYTV